MPAVVAAIFMGIWAALVPGTATAAAQPTAAGSGPPARKQSRAPELVPEKMSRLDVGSLSAAQGAIAGVRNPHGKRIGSTITAEGTADQPHRRGLTRRWPRSILRQPDYEVHP